MSESLKSGLHYLGALVVMAIYGVQVCPFLDSLTPVQLVTPLIVGLALQYGLRALVLRGWACAGPEEKQVGRVFSAEFGLFLATGVAILVFNAAVHGFPLESGLKIIFGLGGLGFFAAVDLSLDAEIKLADHLKSAGRNLGLSERHFPMSRKLGIFAAVATVLVLGIIILIVVKDLEWLIHVGTDIPIERATLSILGEFVFVGVVLLAYILLIIRSYTRNLRYFLDNQARVMARTTDGKLDAWIPVTTNDEFGRIANYTNIMVESLKQRTEEVQRTQDVTILSLASLAETRDNETGAHILRTQRYIKVLAQHLIDHPRFSDYLGEDGIVDLLFKSAPLHDIGKVGIPDAILLKPGKLTDEEFATMRTHADLGADALKVAEDALGGSSFLRIAREIACGHHEKWDGSGYPRGLKGDAIPVSARLMAVADVYDALISKRVYKPSFSHDKAMAILVEGRASHFDPDVIDALLAVENCFKEVAATFSDGAYDNKDAAVEAANPSALPTPETIAAA